MIGNEEFIMALRDEVREQREQLKGKSFKEKWDYFWYYYKAHTIITILTIIVVAIFIRDAVNSKDYAFSALMLNSNGSGIQESLQTDFAEYAGIDTETYECYIDTSATLSYERMSQMDLAMSQRIVAMSQTSGIDAFISNTEPYSNYAQAMMFMDLREVLTEEEYKKHEPNFYYFDAAIVDMNNNEMVYDENGNPQVVDTTVDHSDPSTMKDPVPVGIYLKDSPKVKELNLYPDAEEPPIFGFVYSSEQMENAHLFLKYLTE